MPLFAQPIGREEVKSIFSKYIIACYKYLKSYCNNRCFVKLLFAFNNRYLYLLLFLGIETIFIATKELITMCKCPNCNAIASKNEPKGFQRLSPFKKRYFCMNCLTRFSKFLIFKNYYLVLKNY